MKQIYLMIIVVTFTVNGFSQIHFPSSVDKPIWSESYWQENFETENIDYTYKRIGMIGDTMIDNNLYSKLYSLSDSLLSTQDAKYIGAIREDENKVWYRDTFDIEHMLYDFSCNVGDTIHTDIYLYLVDYVVIESIDTITLSNGEQRKQFTIVNQESGGETKWIEGIGSKIGLLIPFTIPMDCKKSLKSIMCGIQGSSLICHYQKDELIYKNCSGSCFPIATSINDLKNENIKIYPNPAHHFVQIDYKNGIIKSIEILSTTGMILRRKLYTNVINIGDLNKGFYILRIQTNDKKIMTTRLIKN
jgi:hypothetical protein